MPAFSPTGHHSPLPALLVTPGGGLGSRASEEVDIPREGPGNRKRQCQARTHCKAQLASDWHGKGSFSEGSDTPTVDPACLACFSAPSAFAPQDPSLPVSHPSLFSPDTPSTQPSLTLTTVNIPPERLAP